MNPHLKLAYEHGVQQALQEAGITKVALSPELKTRAYIEAQRRVKGLRRGGDRIMIQNLMPHGTNPRLSAEALHTLEAVDRAANRRQAQAFFFNRDRIPTGGSDLDLVKRMRDAGELSPEGAQGLINKLNRGRSIGTDYLSARGTSHLEGLFDIARKARGR